MAAPVLQFKRGNFSALPGLQAGEPGWVVDEFDLFVGIDSTTNNNKIVGSARYWERETATTGSAVRLVEGANNGDHYVALKSPASLTGSQDYILPASATAGGYLKVDGSGNMSWSTEVDIATPLSVLDIDGGTDIGADITDADLFIVDDGGGGTNRKTAASRLKTYVLGGGSGATFAAINVSGIGTVTFADTTTLKVSAGATVTGALDVDGGANVAGGLTVTGSQTVDQLTVSGVATATTFDGALATTNLTGTITNAQLAGSIANDKLANDSISLGGVSVDLGAADATPAFDLQDATNLPTTSLTGTITNAQLAGSIANDKLSNNSVSLGGVSVALGDSDATPAFNLSDATNYPTSSLTGTITNTQLAGSIANAKLANSTVAFGGVTLALGAADATPAFDLADATNYPTSSLVGTITNAQLAGSIANDKLANTSINFGGVNLDLGQTDATPAFNLSDATNYPTSSLVGTISNAQLTGNIANSKLVNDSVSFGGVEVALGAADATPAFDLQDATNLPTTSLTGTITNAQLAGSIADSKLNTVSTANKVALSALDIDGAAATTSVVDADLLVVDDGANGTNRKVTASNLKDYMLGGGAGANFAAINVTGISTVTFAKATTLTVGAGATVTGALDVDGGANIASGLTVGGVVNGTAFHTGAEGSAIRVTSDTISGPATLTIDPAAVGDNTGKVVIAGDLQVDGTTTTVNSTVVNIVDKNIQVATGAADDAAANGAGITVDSGDGDKTFQFEATGDNWGASENINLASGKVLKVNNTEILSATALSSSVVVDAASVNIDGATDIGADLVDADLLLVDDGAGGTNRKTAMSRVKEYVLGGGAGANFSAINVSGIGTVTFADTTTLKVGAGATVTGALDVDGGANIASGLTVTGGLTANSAIVSDLTDNRVVLAGSGGELEDSGNLTFDGSTLAVTGAATVSTDLTVTEELTARDASLRNVVSSGVITATDVRNAAGGLLSLVGVSSASGSAGIVTAFKFRGQGLEDFIVQDGVADVVLTGVASTTFTTTEVKTATQGQTTFTFNAGYQAGFLDLYLNGIRLVTGTDYAATNGSTAVLTNAANAGDELEMVGWKSLGNVVELTSLTTVTDLTVGGIATATTFDGALATTNLTGTITNAQLAGSIANDKLANNTVAFGGVSLALGGTDATPAFNLSDATNYPTSSLTGTITNAQLAGSIANAKLANSSVSLGGVTVALGAADATPAFDLADATNYPTSSLVGTITNAQLAGSIANAKLANDSVSFGGVEVDLGAADATPAFDLQDATNLPTTSLTGTITNAQLAGSIADSKLNTISTANKVSASALDIDGATATSSLADADLLLVDDGANGTNRKLTASNLKSYVLGGGSGATFAQINVTGISTNTFMKSTTATVGAGLTVTGIIDGNGGMNISGAESTMSSATVSDLTDGRIVTAGSAGALEDDANLTWDGSTLGVGGVINGSNGASITGAETVLSSATVSDLTSGRVVLAGSSGAVEDSANLTFNGSTLAVNGSITATSNLTVTGDLVVNGNTTQINTVNTTIEDTLLELQKVDGGNLSSDTNKDVGLVMNYYSGSAKKAAVFWDDSAARFVLASEAAENSGVMTPSTYGGLEVGSLYVNDCAGQSQVISCSGTTRSLENVTIDGGSF